MLRVASASFHRRLLTPPPSLDEAKFSLFHVKVRPFSSGGTRNQGQPVACPNVIPLLTAGVISSALLDHSFLSRAHASSSASPGGSRYAADAAWLADARKAHENVLKLHFLRAALRVQAIIVAGMGFFSDAYDLFSIGLLTKLLGRLYCASAPRCLLYTLCAVR